MKKKSIVGLVICLIVLMCSVSLVVIAEEADTNASQSMTEEVSLEDTSEVDSALSEAEAMAAADASEEEEEIDKNKELYSTGYNPTYIQYDNIDLQSGAVDMKVLDLYLPGINGLDLNIYRMYNSHKMDQVLYALREDEKYEVKCYEYHYNTTDANGNVIDNIVYIKFDKDEDIQDSFTTTEESMKENRERYSDEYIVYYSGLDILETPENGITLTRNINKGVDEKSIESGDRITYAEDTEVAKVLDIQYGWEIIVPNLTLVSRRENKSGSADFYDAVFTDEYGKSYGVSLTVENTGNVDEVTTSIDSAEYTLTAERIGTSNYFNLYFTNIEGQIYTIENIRVGGNVGRIMTIDSKRDRFGNTITYTEVAENEFLITDTYGREIAVNSEGITVKDGEETQKEIEYNRETIYDLDRDPTKELIYFQEYIFTVRESATKDDEGNFTYEETRYIMYPKEIVFTESKAVFSVDSITQYLIKSITYPTGTKITYEYASDDSVERKVIELSSEYIYDRGVYHLYNPTKYTLYEKDDLGEYQWRTSYEYKFNKDSITTETKTVYDDNTTYKTEYKYDIHDRLIKVAMYDDPKAEKAKLTESYTYDSSYTGNLAAQAPIKFIQREGYVGQTSQEVQYHNEKKQVIKTHEGGHFHTYTYDEDYGFVLEEEYSKDFETQIIIRNTKTEDGKSIAESSIYESKDDEETLISETLYTYNPDGTLASETVSPSDGVYLKTEYDYIYGTNAGSYEVVKTTIQMENNIEIVISAETYGYDEFGNLISYTDGNGNETKYIRDLKGRITEEIYPDNASKNVAYNISENSVEITDENGNITVYDYTPMGYIERIYTPEDEMTLEEYEYNGLFRLTAKNTYMDTAQYLRHEYTYSFEGQMLSDTLSMYDGISETYVDTTRYSYEKINTLTPHSIYEWDEVTLSREYGYVYLYSHGNEAVYAPGQYDFLGSMTVDNVHEDFRVYDVSGYQKVYVRDQSDYYTGTAYYSFLKDYELGQGFKGDNLVVRTYYDDPERLSLETEYDSYGNVVRETYYIVDSETSEREDLNEYLYYYDFAGNLIKSTGGEILKYDREYWWLSEESGFLTKTEYNAMGLPTKEYLPMLEGQTEPDFITYEYDNIGRMTKSTDVNGNETLYTYNDARHYTLVTYPFDGDATKMVTTYYYNNGDVAQIREQSNAIGSAINFTNTYYQYDSRNRLICAYDNTYTQYGYDNMGNLIKVVSGLTSMLSNVFTSTIPDTATVTTYEYDRFGNVITETNTAGNSSIYEYNLLGWVTSVTDRNNTTLTTTYNTYGSPLTISDSKGVLKTNIYDADNRLISTSADGLTITYEYDKLGNMIREEHTSADILKEYTYDLDGRVITEEIYALGKREMDAYYIYDKRGRLIEKMFNDSNANVTYEYYNDDRLKSETRGGYVTEYEYNDAGLNTNTQTKYYDTGTGDYIIIDANSSTYLLSGNVVTRTVIGGTMNYTYDGLGQLVSETWTDTRRVTYQATYTYDSNGNRIRSSDNEKVVTYTYDKDNRLINEVATYTSTQEVDGKIHVYDNNGNLVYMGHSGNNADGSAKPIDIHTYAYDSLGQLLTVTYSVQNVTPTLAYSTLESVKDPVIECMGTIFEDGEMTEGEYEQLRESVLRWLEEEKNEEYTVVSPYYVEEEEFFIEETEEEITEEVIEDEPGEEIESEEEISEEETGEVAEDEVSGEIIEENSEEMAADDEITLEDAEGTELIEEETVEDEIAEDEIADEETLDDETGEEESEISEEEIDEVAEEIEEVEEVEEVEAISQNEAITPMSGTVLVHRVEYYYNPDGTRQKKMIVDDYSISYTYHVWNGDNIVMETMTDPDWTSPDDVQWEKYYRGIHLISNGSDYFIYDDLGNIVELTSTGNILANRQAYTAFGVTDDRVVDAPFGYRGEYYDEETGFIYLRNRYYDPSNGRFISEDPIKDGLNWYVYCYNNPIMFVDPSGTQPEFLKKVKKFLENTKPVKWFYEKTVSNEFDAVYEVVGFTRDNSGVYHAKSDAWQQYFGYNDFYDKAFDLATNMKSEKYSFAAGDQNFTIWMWKGDYLNLGNGAEIGIYKGDGYHLDCATDYQLPIKLSLHTTSGTKIFEYSDTTWWATGFNPKHHNLEATDMKMTATIDFSEHKDLYNGFKEEYEYKSYLTFDDKKYTVSINW